MRPAGEDFSGYGPARYFTVQQVAELAAVLGSPEIEQEAAGRYDPARMTEVQIYPFGWEPGAREWLLYALADLRAFYTGAAAGGRAVVTCLV